MKGGPLWRGVPHGWGGPPYGEVPLNTPSMAMALIGIALLMSLMVFADI